jgi:hypothetical protein
MYKVSAHNGCSIRRTHSYMDNDSEPREHICTESDPSKFLDDMLRDEDEPCAHSDLIRDPKTHLLHTLILSFEHSNQVLDRNSNQHHIGSVRLWPDQLLIEIA